MRVNEGRIKEDSFWVHERKVEILDGSVEDKGDVRNVKGWEEYVAVEPPKEECVTAKQGLCGEAIVSSGQRKSE